MKLIKPSIAFKTEYLEMLEDWKRSQEELVPFSLAFDTSDFQQFLERNELRSKQPEEGFVCYSTFWLLNEENKIVGTSNIRHTLTDKLRQRGGHIGYGIRPSYRRRGYATKILELSLIEAKELGIGRALVTCSVENVGSAKAILKNGGVLRRTEEVNGEACLSFWVLTH